MNRSIVVWTGLIAATAVSVGVGLEAAAVALVIGFAKVRYVGLEFMELRAAPVALRAAFEVWLVVVGATLVGLQLAG